MNETFNVFGAIALTLMVLLVFAYIRNEVTFSIRMKAIDQFSNLAHLAIKRGEPWERFYEIFNQRTYNSILFDISVWTWRQAYPELSTLVKEKP